MGRSRIIKGDTFRSRSLARCSRDARLTFIGLWTECDDAGRGVADPDILCGLLWPLDRDITPEVVEDHLLELADTDHIVLYMADGERFFYIKKWEKHQAAAYRKGVPKYPDPHDESVSTILHASACNDSPEVKGSEWKGSISRPLAVVDASSRPRSKPTPPVSDDDFDRFWAAYPRKDSKKEARTALVKAMKITSLETILAGLPVLQRKAQENPRDLRFIPLAATWLNKERWNDESAARTSAPVLNGVPISRFMQG